MAFLPGVRPLSLASCECVGEAAFLGSGPRPLSGRVTGRVLGPITGGLAARYCPPAGEEARMVTRTCLH